MQIVQDLIKRCLKEERRFMVLTGAGISAESGIPTFRGPDGYWTVGSKEYHPQEMATFRMFRQHPEEVWSWYLYRMGILKKANPNKGHLALAQLEEILPAPFTLVTQNVDNLHLRAGSRTDNTFQIHGNILFCRCSSGCTTDIYPIPHTVSPKEKGERLTDTDRKELCCPVCREMARPHVLWFDESYNEHHFHYESVLTHAEKTGLLIVVGTSGETTLPRQIAETVLENRGAIVDINIEENIFSKMAKLSSHGRFLKGRSTIILPLIVDKAKELLSPLPPSI